MQFELAGFSYQHRGFSPVISRDRKGNRLNGFRFVMSPGVTA